MEELTPSQLDAILPTLQVLARSSPKDKNILASDNDYTLLPLIFHILCLQVRRLNGNLPRTAAEWQEEHPDNDWGTERDKLLPG